MALVGVTELAEHLATNREGIARLIDQRVFKRRPDGKYDLDKCRVAYIEHLRKRPEASVGRRQFEAARAKREELRLKRECHEVCYTREFDQAVDQIAFSWLNHLAPVPARIGGPDLALRRRAEQELRTAQEAVSEDLKRLSETLHNTGKAP